MARVLATAELNVCGSKKYSPKSGQTFDYSGSGVCFFESLVVCATTASKKIAPQANAAGGWLATSTNRSMLFIIRIFVLEETKGSKHVDDALHFAHMTQFPDNLKILYVSRLIT